MPAMDELFDRLAHQTPPDNELAAAELLKQEWLDDLDTLLDQLTQWLAPGEQRGLLKIDRVTEALSEPDVGEYEAPALTLEFLKPTRRVFVKPRGMQIVGVIPHIAPDGERRRLDPIRGRVDLIRGPSRATLMRSLAGDWMIRGMYSTDTVEPLTEKSFAEVLDDLLGL